jgi:hypothetical protein
MYFQRSLEIMRILGAVIRSERPDLINEDLRKVVEIFVERMSWISVESTIFIEVILRG